MTSVMSSAWSDTLAQNNREVRGSIIRDLLRLTQRPTVISFAGGLPAPECFPVKEITNAAERVLIESPLAALQYGPTEGYLPLRELVVERAVQAGIRFGLDNVMITTGSQQALDLIGRLIINPGDLVAVEDPTYLGALQSWQSLDANYVTIPMDEQGLRVDVLGQMLADGLRPRFLYMMPTFQNPTGITLAAERRCALVELATHYSLPIVEDDAYGELYYNDVRPTPLAAIDVKLNGCLGNVIYISSFSKVLAPGLRVGWAAAPADLIASLVKVKQGIDLHTTSLSQATVYEAVRDGLLERHVPFIRDTYRTRRDAMLAALKEHMPEGVRWVKPEGGMFVWLLFPEHIDSTELFHVAIEHDVAFVPGPPLYANGGGEHTARLNFSLPSLPQIEEGITRLGRSIRNMM